MSVICASCGRTNDDSAIRCSGCNRPMSFDPAGMPMPEAPILVGRELELSVLLAGLDGTIAGRGELAMLVGEAGIGKTWIAREAARRAAARGAVVLWGSCLEGDWQPAYGPWVEAIGEYARDAAPQHLRDALGTGAPPLVRLVPRLRAVLRDTPEAAPLRADEERVRIYDAVIRFLLGLARESPVLIVLDDLHWADRDSLGLLRYLSRFVPRSRIMIIVAYREPALEGAGLNDLEGLLPVLRHDIDFRRVTVRGLNLQEVGEYLSRAAGQALPGALVQAIYKDTDGNPFYVREVYRHLIEEGKILFRGERWSTDFSIGELGIPEGVRQVVHRRLSRLSRESGALLRLAAGFAGGFEFSTLQALTQLPEETLLDCIDQTLRAGLLTIVRSTPPAYDFAHAIVRHTIYDGLNPDRRARLHRRIVVSLERVYADQELRHAAEIAAQYHASIGLSGAAKGIPYALSAAEQARAGYGHEQAVTFLRMARDLSWESDAGTKADILCKLAIAEAEDLLLNNSQQTAEEALVALTEAGSGPSAQAAFLAQIGQALKDGGASPALWEPLVERGLSLCGEERDLAWARLTLLRGRLEPIPSGTIHAARWLGQDKLAVSIARASGDEDDYARTLESLEWRTSEETATVLALVRTWQHPSATMRALGVLGRDLLRWCNDFREATALYQELLAISERCGSIAGQGEALLQIAIIQAVVGQLSLAQETARRAQDMIVRLGPQHELRFQERGLASTLAYFVGGDWHAMATGASRFAAALGGAQNPRAHLAAASAALAHSQAGNTAEAHQLLAELTPVVAKIEPTIYVHQVVVLFAATAVWDIGAAEFAGTYRRLAHAIIEAGFGSNLLPHLLTVARMAALLGDMVEAHQYFDRGRAVLDAGGLRPSRAIADYEEALALSRAGSADRARILALLDVSLAAFQSLGMGSWAGRAIRLKEKLASPVLASGGPDHPHPDGLTGRELELLRLLATGRTNNQIAEELVLSVRTVERHIANIYTKIGAHSRVDATTYALRAGICRTQE